ncbi:MAG: exopolysaccharide biosynthesis protein [Pseudorhizobium sp.]
MEKAAMPEQTSPGPEADDEDAGLTQLVDKLADLGRIHDNVSVLQIRERIGERSFGPFLVVPSLIELSPVGGIPGVPTAIAAIVGLIAVQIAIGMKHMWLPDFIEHRAIPGQTLQRGLDFLRPAARWIDRILRPRLRWITRTPARQVVAVLCLLLAATVPPLEVLPFASSLPMGAIALFGLALMVRDGVVALVAAGFAVGTGALLYTTFL